jgi:hypothetical protein
MGERLGYEDLPLVQALKVLMLGALAQGWPEEDLAWAVHLAMRQAVRQFDSSLIPAPQRSQHPSHRVRVLGLDEED